MCKYRDPSPRAFAYVDQICVAQRSRGQGIGRALLARAGDRARELGRDRLELDVWSDNRRAKTAFEALGFKTYTEKMKLGLDLAGDSPGVESRYPRSGSCLMT